MIQREGSGAATGGGLVAVAQPVVGKGVSSGGAGECAQAVGSIEGIGVEPVLKSACYKSIAAVSRLINRYVPPVAGLQTNVRRLYCKKLKLPGCRISSLRGKPAEDNRSDIDSTECIVCPASG